MDDRIKRSRKQEKDGARRFGGTVSSGSGNGEKFKSDVRTDAELIEFKRTDNQSYRLELAELDTAWRHAVADDRQMVFGIEYGDAIHLFRRGTPSRYVVLAEDDYLALTEES
jgi:hypothetical protein